MRITLLLIVSVLITPFAEAQNETLRLFAAKYSQDEAVTHITLRGGLLKLFRDKSGNNSVRTGESHIDGLEIISFDSRSALREGDLSSLYRGIEAEEYEELMRVRSDGDWVNLYLLEEEQGAITDVLLLVEGEDDFCLIHLTGRMTYEDLEQIDLDDDKGGDAFRRLPRERRRGEQP